MKTLKNTALIALCFALTGLTAMNADAGCRSKGGYAPRGGYKPHSYRPSYKPVRYAPPKIAPPKPAPPVVAIPVGATIKIPGHFGKPGHVILNLAGVELHAKVLAWTPKGLTVLIPSMALAAPAPGKLLVFGYDKRVHRTFAVKIVPPAPKKAAPGIHVQPSGPQSPQGPQQGPQGTPQPVAAPGGAPAQAAGPAASAQPAQPAIETVNPEVQINAAPTQAANPQELPDDLK